MEIEIVKAEIAKLELKPGDRVILFVDTKLPKGTIKELEDQMVPLFKGHEVIVFDSSAKLAILGG